jgi:hypothetical protein
VPDCTIDLDFADGSYTFKLPLKQIHELETKCREASGVPSGIGAIFARVLKGCVPVNGEVMLVPGSAEFYVSDVVETLRQGLIGGGAGVVSGEDVKVTPALANRLIDTYVLERPLSDSWSAAASVLGACIIGYDPPKKDMPANERAQAAVTEASTTH